MSYRCGGHDGECNTVTTPEGTFCRLTGVEVAGPQVVCHDFRHCCNSTFGPLRKNTVLRRKRASLGAAKRRHMSVNKYRVALEHLYGADSRWHALAVSLKEWSEALNIERPTVAASRAWAIIFAATVTSKLAQGEPARDGELLPQLPLFQTKPIDPTAYREKGVVCRSMSTMWHRIKGAALDDDGRVKTPLVLPDSILIVE